MRLLRDLWRVCGSFDRLVLLLGLVSAVFLAVDGVNNVRVKSRCLAAGYPDYRAHLVIMPSYCVKRVNQTDSVVRLDRVPR